MAHVGAKNLRKLAFLLVVVAGVAFATPADAHSVLTGSDPVDGSTITALPAVVTLTFNENVQSKYETIAVTDATGKRIDGNKPAVLDNTITETLNKDADGGKYTMNYRVISADGHPVSGSLSFTYEKAGAASATTAPAVTASTTKPQGHTPKHFLVPITLAVVLVAIGFVEAIRRVRTR